MKILHINSYYSNGNFYKNLFDTQVDFGLDIKVYVPVSVRKTMETKKMGFYCETSYAFNELDRLLFFPKQKKILSDIENKLKIETFDVVHAHSLFSNGYVAYQLFKKYNIPYIVAVRNTDVNIFFKKAVHLRRIGEKILQSAERVIFLSDTYRDHVLQKYISDQNRNLIFEKTRIIPNGIDAFWTRNLYSHKEKTNSDRINLLCVATIDANKNQIKLVDACELLIQEGWNIHLSLAGAVLDKDVYYKIICKPFVEYLGVMDKEELIYEYRKNDIFVMPSKTETFGLVYAEALSQGMPIIYTKNQGFDKQFPEGYIGYHVNAECAEDIAVSIKNVRGHYPELTKNCTEAIKKFNWTTIGEAYLELYRTIKENRSK